MQDGKHGQYPFSLRIVIRHLLDHASSSQAKLARAGFAPSYENSLSSESTAAFHPYDPDNIPLTSQSHEPVSPYQHRWSEHVYAPQPIKPGRVPISQHHIALTPEYGSDHGRYDGRGSTDDVGWEMNVSATRNARPEDTYGLPFSSAESVQHVGMSNYTSSSPAQQQQRRSADGRLAPPSPQAGMRNPHPSVGGGVDEQIVYRHGQEPTDASYRTALSGSSRESSFVDDLHPSTSLDPPTPRLASPPPPGYRMAPR
jgi:hypothetical protein